MISLIALISVLICLSPIMAAENNAHFTVKEFNLFGSSAPKLTLENLIIEKIKTEHTDSAGQTDKYTDYYMKFDVKSEGDFNGNYTVKIQCLDKNNKTIKNITSYVDHDGAIKIKLPGVSDIDRANVNIFYGDSVIVNGSTSKMKFDQKITSDELAETTSSSSSSSSSSSATYWASSNSGKFHNPSCEWAQKISGKNKVVFHSRDEAINAGYQPCQVCGP